MSGDDLNFWVITACLVATWFALFWYEPHHAEPQAHVTVVDSHGQILGFALRVDLNEAMLGGSHTVTIHDGAP